MQCLKQQNIKVWSKGLTFAGLVFTMLLAPALSNAKIYKTVDEDGNVSYSDTPPADVEARAESTIELEINNTYNAEESNPTPVATNKTTQGNRPGDIVTTGDPGTDTKPAAVYQKIAITAPAADANLRSNEGKVTLSISLQPGLVPGDQVRFFLDGKPVGTVTGTSLSLTNIDRGTHTLAAVVLDGAGKPRISSNTSSFSIQRFAPRR